MGTKKRIVLSDHKAKIRDRSIDIEGEDGETYSCPPPELWPDHVFTLLAQEDITGAAQAIMGDADKYARWISDGGGSAMLLISIAKEEAGLGLGE